MNIGNYYEKIHENNIKYINTHVDEINDGTRKFLEYALKDSVKQLNNDYDSIIIVKEFECFSKEDRLIDDIRRVCMDVQKEEYILVSIKKLTRMLDVYGFKVLEQKKVNKLNSLIIDFIVSKADFIKLINFSKKEKVIRKRKVSEIV